MARERSVAVDENTKKELQRRAKALSIKEGRTVPEGEVVERAIDEDQETELNLGLFR